MPVPGPLELVLILVIVAMLFGVGKLPEVFGSIGKGIREFRKESTLEDSTTKAEAQPAQPAQAAPAQTQAQAPAPTTETAENGSVS
jgi:sec-independent protein translocase protein TatA